MINPNLKKKGPPADGQDPAAGAMSELSSPARLQPGQAAPDVNPQAAGTRFGNALRDTRRDIVNDQVAVLNTANRGGAAMANAATAIPRAIGGFTRDTTRAALGMDPSPNAGNSLGGLTAPQIAKPYPQAPVNFALTHADVPVRRPDFSSVTGGVVGGSAAAPTPAGNPAAAAGAQGAPGGATAVQPGVDSGTIVEGGRKLSYGAMVDGVPTYSDGSSGIPGVAGSIPRTMSDQAIAGLGARAQVIPAQVSTLASDSMGGGTPTQGQMVDRRVAEIQRPITGSRPSAEQFAAADRNAIAMRDPRSPGGIAARNLAVEAQYGSTPRLRRIAEAALVNLQHGTQQDAVLGQQAESAQDLQARQADSALALENVRGANTLRNTAAEQAGKLLNTPLEKSISADGTIQMIDTRTGAVINTRQADGTPAKAAVSKDDSVTKRRNEVLDQITTGTQKQLSGFMPTKDMPTPTAEMVAQARELSAAAAGHEVRTGKDGKKYININGEVVAL